MAMTIQLHTWEGSRFRQGKLEELYLEYTISSLEIVATSLKKIKKNTENGESHLIKIEIVRTYS